MVAELYPNPLRPTLAARALGVTADFLKAEAAAGRIPCLKAGDRFLFDFEAVREVLAKRAKVEYCEPPAAVQRGAQLA